MIALLWPAGNEWPPEIDFAESGGGRNERNHVTATVHYGANDNQVQRTVRGNFSRWHVLGVTWSPGTLVYTLDGYPWAAVHSTAVPSEAMELDLQAQAGTCGDIEAPCPDATTPRRVNM